MHYGNEGMDCKKYFLFLLGKLWLVILAAVIGAVLGGGSYLFYHVVINKNREYQAESKVYLDFAPDATGEVYQAYNGYTWNDLMSTDPILDMTMTYLPGDYTREEVIAATSAQILSDVRLLTITVVTPDADRSAEILRATDLSLVELGKREKEFIDIRIYKETEPQIVAAGDRLLQAVSVGAVLALIGMLLAMALIYVLDDKIYVPGDLKSFTRLPFIGYCFSERKEGKAGREQKIRESFRKDLERNQAYLAKKVGTVTVLGIEECAWVTEEEAEELREADGILLVIPYGRMDRTTCCLRIEEMLFLECKLAGIMIQDADMRFMKWYYNHL